MKILNFIRINTNGETKSIPNGHVIKDWKSIDMVLDNSEVVEFKRGGVDPPKMLKSD